MTDAENDLVLTRVLDAPRDKLWRCWTEPDLLKQWFCPKPWYVSQARIDLHPGGEFFTLMNGPNGEQFGEPGVFLEIVDKERLMFTDAFRPGWRLQTGPLWPQTWCSRTLAPARPATSGAPCTGPPRRARSTKTWAFTRAGARPPTSSKPSPAHFDRKEH